MADLRLRNEIEKVGRLLEALRKVQSRSWYRIWKDDGGDHTQACVYCHCSYGDPHAEGCPFFLLDDIDPPEAQTKEVRRDLFGEEVPEVPKEKRLFAIILQVVELQRVYDTYPPKMEELFRAVEELLRAYSIWLD